MDESAPFRLETQQLGPLPVVNHFLERLGLGELLARHVPPDGRAQLPPAVALAVVVRNLVLHREPVYALGEWAAPYAPAVVGLGGADAALLNDDRVGRDLARLFAADRATLVTELVLRVLARFGVSVDELHNDSTSIRFSGVYRDAGGAARHGIPTAAITYGHSKDHRPDLKQLLWILTVAGDGAVPIAYRVAPGNTADDVTHIPTWNSLVALTGRADFLYVADCKLASGAAMAHIDANGGRFLTVLPRNRPEDHAFRDAISVAPPVWTEVARRRSRTGGEPDDMWWATEPAEPSADGYRLVWVRSSVKSVLDANVRRDHIARAVAALADLDRRLGGGHSRLRTVAAVQAAVARAMERSGAGRWISCRVEETVTETQRYAGPGRPRTGSLPTRTVSHSTFRLQTVVDRVRVATDAASDGCVFPLITNDRRMTPAELLAAYKYQPNLERRHAQLKGTQLVAPVFLKDVARIEGLLCCHFMALLVQALIEREIRTAMARSGRETIPLYPEDRACASPSAARVLEIFNGLARHRLLADGQLVQTFEPTLTPLQREVLALLGIPESAFTSTWRDGNPAES